ncbi:MAG TPA: PA0069 family radical SAM protein [Halothiobacillaceae bacterium]|nr:PA0069 family radical SAM protein [Halothiobacillaceae bacterium]
MVDALSDRPRKGRGAVGNPTGRYEPQVRLAIDDGWGLADESPPPLRTALGVDSARKIISRNQSPDVPFDRSINPYKGCEHGCVYCFARPTHAYLGHSPGLDFESRLYWKPDAPELLARELADPKYRPATIALGANTDPYQPVEREKRLTRRILEVLAEFGHPVGIVTKSNLVLRDLDILAPMARLGIVRVAISLTTLDRSLARRMEPRAPTPARRLEAIRELARAGVPVTVLAAPLIPAINDHEIERILQAAAGAGAGAAGYVLLRLPLEIKDLFAEWLQAHFPDRAARVMKLVRETRDGALYQSEWRKRQTGTGVYAEQIARRFDIACRRHALDRGHPPLDETRFRRPPRPGDQLTLL